MQEGTLALMQLVKTCAAVERLARSRACPTSASSVDPTTGGVFASFAALGDVNIAEPNALIGFAGARVAAGTTGDELPEGFQRSEFLFKHGFVDLVVPRADLREEVTRLLRYLQPRPERHHNGGNGSVLGRRPWQRRCGGHPWLAPTRTCRTSHRWRRETTPERRDPGHR